MLMFRKERVRARRRRFTTYRHNAALRLYAIAMHAPPLTPLSPPSRLFICHYAMISFSPPIFDTRYRRHADERLIYFDARACAKLFTRGARCCLMTHCLSRYCCCLRLCHVLPILPRSLPYLMFMLTCCAMLPLVYHTCRCLRAPPQ